MSTDTSPSGVRALLLLRDWLPSRAVLPVVAALGLLGGVLEAGVLGLIAATGATMARGGDDVVVSLGPWALDTTVTVALVAGAVATVAMVLVRLATARASTDLAAATLVRTRTSLLERFLSASYETQRASLQAELHELIAVQTMRLSQAVLLLTAALGNALTFAALVGAAFLFDPLTAGALLGLAIVLAGVFLPIMRRSNKAGASVLSTQVQVGVDLGDVTGLLAETHVFGARTGMLGRANRSVEEAGRAFRTASWAAQLTPALYLGAVMGLLLTGLAVLSIAGIDDIQVVGAIVLLTLRGLRYSQQVQAGLQLAVEQAPNVVAVDTASRRFTEAAVASSGTELDRLEELELRDVAYRHPGTDEGIAEVSVHLRRGEVVGVVGHSGAGKSTFAEVVLGLREPAEGTVLVNGVDRGSFHARSWFARVAYVGQESRLLAGSVAANVAFFRDLPDGAVASALTAASLGDDLARWSDGDQREVGAGGRDVSGGQRQRIAIARALAGGPDLVVMDEPTSALDTDSEQRVRDAIAALAGEVLVIVIAHRPSTLRVCDRILRFEDGRATEVPPGEAVDELLA
ncbi:ABC transporter ATP-binding protein [Nitriliruptoraceae bacterium ZYF776]|nr:ABC transporter ATP-binding protein [Profundirhabdus halotolerans]